MDIIWFLFTVYSSLKCETSLVPSAQDSYELYVCVSLCVVCHIAFFMLRQQPCHYHFIRMPETACPSLLPLNYLPVSLKKSGSHPDRLSGEEREVHLSHFNLPWDKYCLNMHTIKGKSTLKTEITLH